ncbi:MAG: RNA polymerase sigma-54 factor, partial [Leadbetterella sp.]|nr:RNA polymerase sigma-54 factor [Leadbetterella sp.]
AETLKIAEGTQEMLKSTRDKKAAQFILKKMEDANWIIEALRQRDDTMLRVMRVIAVMQRDFLLSGDLKLLKPMILRDVAAYVDLDVSTVSRVTSAKYVQSPFGIFNLKELFTHTFTAQDGRELNNQDIQDCLVEIVAKESKSKPLNDTELCHLLAEKGYPVARRTVAKYREQLQIPIAALRRNV